MSHSHHSACIFSLTDIPKPRKVWDSTARIRVPHSIPRWPNHDREDQVSKGRWRPGLARPLLWIIEVRHEPSQHPTCSASFATQARVMIRGCPLVIGGNRSKVLCQPDLVGHVWRPRELTDWLSTNVQLGFLKGLIGTTWRVSAALRRPLVKPSTCCGCRLAFSSVRAHPPRSLRHHLASLYRAIGKAECANKAPHQARPA